MEIGGKKMDDCFRLRIQMPEHIKLHKSEKADASRAGSLAENSGVGFDK